MKPKAEQDYEIRKRAGAAVAAALKRKDATVDSVGALIGATPSTVARWATGLNFPPASRAENIIKDLGVKP